MTIIIEFIIIGILCILFFFFFVHAPLAHDNNLQLLCIVFFIHCELLLYLLGPDRKQYLLPNIVSIYIFTTLFYVNTYGYL